MQITKGQLADALDALIDAGAPFDPAAVFIGVYTAITPHGLDTVLADLTLPDAADFPATAVTTWGTPYSLVDGRRVVDAPPKVVRPPTDPDAITIVGWYIADAATAGNLLAYQSLPAPVPLPTAQSVWTLVFRLTLDPSGRWDVSISFNG